MKTQTITIVSELGNGVQAWTFDISEADLNKLMEKYDGKGSSVVGASYEIADEIAETYHNYPNENAVRFFLEDVGTGNTNDSNNKKIKNGF